MNYKSSPIQRDFYIECLLNQEANTKYNINMIFSINAQKNINDKMLLQAICEVINQQPILLSTPIIEGSEIYLKSGDTLNLHEIEFEKFTQLSDKDDIFQSPFDLVNDKRLFRLKVIKQKEGSWLLLLAVHHFVFDFYSAKAFSQQLADSLDEGNTFTVETFKNEFDFTESKFSERGSLEKYRRIFVNRFSEFSIGQEEELEHPPVLTKKEYQMEIKIVNVKDKSYRSAILIAAFAYAYLKNTGKDSIVIGVPIPNRVRGNMNIVDGLVTTYPVIVTKKQTIIDCRESVYKQLIQNLKMQFYDFNKTFYKFTKFDMMFTYYPSNFKINNKSVEIRMEKLFTILPPSPIHFMLNDSNILMAEFFTNQIKDVDQFLDDGFSYLK